MNQNTNVNLIPKFPFSGNLYFSQYDVGRVATINLVEDGSAYTIPSGATVKIQATKPSGLGFSVDCTYSGSVVTVVSTETMTNEHGRFPCELRIENGGVLLGTTNFTFNVEKSPHPDGTTDGTAESVVSEITVALQNALADIQAESTTQIAYVQAEGTTQKGLVTSEGTTQIANVQAEGNTQVGNVQAKGTEVLDSIPSDYTELSEEVADLKSEIQEFTLEQVGANINNATYEGGYINSQGVDTTAASYETIAFRTKDYIPVIGGKTVYWWGKLSDGTALGANAVIVEYDSQKNLIGQRHPFNKYGTTTDNQAFTTSSNAAYVRIALYQGVEDKSTIQIALYYSGDEQTEFIPYQSDKVLNYDKVYTVSGDSLDDVIGDKIADIGFSPIYELQSITVTGESGALMPDGSVRETTDVKRYKIPVLAGEKYLVSARHGYAYRAFLVLDSDSNVLSYFPTTTSGTAIHRNVEVNIAEDGFLVVQNVYNFPPYIGKAISVDFNDKLYQKSIYWNGDSICYGAGGFSFANQIGLIHAMPETMDAVSGTRLSTRSGATNSIYERVIAMDTTAEYDFIGIEGGYNDYFSSVAIGTLTANYTDSPDTTTVIGAVEGICKHIRTNFPNSKFFFVLGHRPIAVGAYPTDVDTYWDAIITALNKWAVPYVDIRKEGTLMAYNIDWLTSFFSEGETMGTHPNELGYKLFYVPLVEAKMKELAR